MSLTREEIIDVTEEYLDVKYEYQATDDFVIQAWINFFEEHRLNPLNEHKFVFKAQPFPEPWEEIKYNIRWIPEVTLGRNSFEYEKVYLGISLYEEDGIGLNRPRCFIPEVYSHGLIQ